MEIPSQTQFEEIKKIFELQKENSKIISQTSYKERKQKLKKLLKLILEKSGEIEKAVYYDFKKPAPEVKLTEIFTVTTEIKHALRNLNKWMKPKIISTPITFFGSSNKIIYESKRTALIISPWNFPFMLAMSPLVSAIAAGNCVIIKPSEYSPNTSTLLKKLLKEIFHENEVAVFTGDHATAQYLLQLPFGHIFFTGSTEVGKIVMEAAAKNLSSVTLELGGKSPAIIDVTANLKETAERISWGKFFNAGQTCIAPDYLIVNKKIKQKLVDELKTAVEKLYGSLDKISSSPDYCRIINEKHTARAIEIFEEAKIKGANVEFGGDFDKQKKYFQPALITNVDLNSRLMTEEIFSPILPLITYEKEKEILEIINNNPNPLAMYIFSKNKNFTKYLISAIPAGGVTINDVVVHFVNVKLPFGGTAASGFGKSHGFSGFKSFSNEKPIMKQPAITPLKFLYPPYTKFVKKLIELTVKYF